MITCDTDDVETQLVPSIPMVGTHLIVTVRTRVIGLNSPRMFLRKLRKCNCSVYMWQMGCRMCKLTNI